MIDTTTYHYAHASVYLTFFRVKTLSDEIQLKEYAEIKWVHPGDLINLDVPAANRGVIEKLMNNKPL